MTRCPECGEKLSEGRCAFCGYQPPSSEEQEYETSPSRLIWLIALLSIPLCALLAPIALIWALLEWNKLRTGRIDPAHRSNLTFAIVFSLLGLAIGCVLYFISPLRGVERNLDKTPPRLNR